MVSGKQLKEGVRYMVTGNHDYRCIEYLGCQF